MQIRRNNVSRMGRRAGGRGGQRIGTIVVINTSTSAPCSVVAVPPHRFGLGQAELKHPCTWLLRGQPRREYAESSAGIETRLAPMVEMIHHSTPPKNQQNNKNCV